MGYVTATSARCYRRKIVESIVMTGETPTDKVESNIAIILLPIIYLRGLGVLEVRQN